MIYKQHTFLLLNQQYRETQKTNKWATTLSDKVLFDNVIALNSEVVKC